MTELKDYLTEHLSFAAKLVSPDYITQAHRMRLKHFANTLAKMLSLVKNELAFEEIHKKLKTSCADLYIPTNKNQIMSFRWRRQFLETAKDVILVLLQTSLTLEQFNEAVQKEKEDEQKEYEENWKRYDLQQLEYKIPEKIVNALVGVKYIHFNYEILIVSENPEVLQKVKDSAVGTKFNIKTASNAW